MKIKHFHATDAQGCVGDENGDCTHLLNDFDHAPESDDNEEGAHDSDLFDNFVPHHQS